MNKPQSTYPLRLPTSVKAGKHKKTWARRTRLIARLHQTQPTRHERILQAVSDRAEILFFAYQPSRVQSLEGFVHRGSGEAVARQRLCRTQIFAAFVDDGLERSFLLAVEAVPNLGVGGILASY